MALCAATHCRLPLPDEPGTEAYKIDGNRVCCACFWMFVALTGDWPFPGEVAGTNHDVPEHTATYWKKLHKEWLVEVERIAKLKRGAEY